MEFLKFAIVKMAPKSSMRDKGKDAKTSIEYNRTRFTSVEVKFRFYKVTKINKSYLV